MKKSKILILMASVFLLQLIYSNNKKLYKSKKKVVAGWIGDYFLKANLDSFIIRGKNIFIEQIQTNQLYALLLKEGIEKEFYLNRFILYFDIIDNTNIINTNETLIFSNGEQITNGLNYSTYMSRNGRYKKIGGIK